MQTKDSNLGPMRLPTSENISWAIDIAKQFVQATTNELLEAAAILRGIPTASERPERQREFWLSNDIRNCPLCVMRNCPLLGVHDVG